MRFGLAQAFDIDDGSLSSLSQEEIFTLGVEWGRAWELAKAPSSFAISVHAANETRISAMLVNQGRRFDCGPATGRFIEFSVAGLD